MVLALIVPLFAGACGSSSAPKRPATQVVQGPGFRFSAPASWRVRRTSSSVAARSPTLATALVSAAAYRLGRAYTSDRFAEAARELDAVAAKLARAAGGRVVASETTTAAGRKIRAYRFTLRDDAGRRLVGRVGFVLSGKREVQLLCQAPAGAGDPDGGCALLFESFRLTRGS